MNSKHKKTLDRVFKKQANIKWKEIESLFIHLGAEITQGNGSRIRIQLNGRVATFHEPHPSPDADKGVIKRIKEFLIDAGVTYDEV